MMLACNFSYKRLSVARQSSLYFNLRLRQSRSRWHKAEHRWNSMYGQRHQLEDSFASPVATRDKESRRKVELLVFIKSIMSTNGFTCVCGWYNNDIIPSESHQRILPSSLLNCQLSSLRTELVLTVSEIWFADTKQNVLSYLSCVYVCVCEGQITWIFSEILHLE